MQSQDPALGKIGGNQAGDVYQIRRLRRSTSSRTDNYGARPPLPFNFDILESGPGARLREGAMRLILTVTLSSTATVFPQSLVNPTRAAAARPKL